MNFRFTPIQERLRAEVRGFLDADRHRWPVKTKFDRGFSERLAERGWIGVGWPRELGGGGLGPVEQMIFTEEFARSGAPIEYHFTAERQVAPSLMRHGSGAQRERWLPRIARANLSVALGLSEPGAGSDLAALETRAARQGDTYVVNGSKIWTSNGHLTETIWLVARTDPAAPKHRGISCFLVDMATPGIAVNPILDLRGEHHFNEVAFENVVVPVDRRIGDENAGWYVLAEHLDFERSGIERLVELEGLLGRILDRYRSTAHCRRPSPRLRLELADLTTSLEVIRLLCYRSAWLQSAGRTPNAEAAMTKLLGSEWCQRVTNAAMKVLGLEGSATTDDPLALEGAREYLHAVSRTIGGGTSEVQRNILATRGLGLPR